VSRIPGGKIKREKEVHDRGRFLVSARKIHKMLRIFGSGSPPNTTLQATQERRPQSKERMIKERPTDQGTKEKKLRPILRKAANLIKGTKVAKFSNLTVSN